MKQYVWWVVVVIGLCSSLGLRGMTRAERRDSTLSQLGGDEQSDAEIVDEEVHAAQPTPRGLLSRDDGSSSNQLSPIGPPRKRANTLTKLPVQTQGSSAISSSGSTGSLMQGRPRATSIKELRKPIDPSDPMQGTSSGLKIVVATDWLRRRPSRRHRLSRGITDGSSWGSSEPGLRSVKSSDDNGDDTESDVEEQDDGKKRLFTRRSSIEYQSPKSGLPLCFVAALKKSTDENPGGLSDEVKQVLELNSDYIQKHEKQVESDTGFFTRMVELTQKVLKEYQWGLEEKDIYSGPLNGSLGQIKSYMVSVPQRKDQLVLEAYELEKCRTIELIGPSGTLRLKVARNNNERTESADVAGKNCWRKLIHAFCPGYGKDNKKEPGNGFKYILKWCKSGEGEEEQLQSSPRKKEWQNRLSLMCMLFQHYHPKWDEECQERKRRVSFCLPDKKDDTSDETARSEEGMHD